MSIFITGDTHSRSHLYKLFSMNFDETGLDKNDYMIICGDFGLVWGNENSMGKYAREKTLDWLDKKNFTTLFVDGNHEDFDCLEEYPVEMWHGGKVQRIRPSVIHLMRGQIYDIDGCSFFCMGGAASIDKHLRYPHESWWEQELPSKEERQEALDNLNEYGRHIDYVLTHDAPASVVYALATINQEDYEADEYERWLQSVADNLDFDKWFFGHFHTDALGLGLNSRYNAMFLDIYDLDECGVSSRVKSPLYAREEDLPEPTNELGYTFEELADIAGVTLEKTEEATKYNFYGATCGVNDAGEPVVYRYEACRVLNWL